MKKNNIYKRITFLFLLLSGMVFFASCSEENDEAKGAYVDTSIPAPVVNVVRTVNEEGDYKAVNQGVLENMYTIHGKNLANTISIRFNGYETYFNPTFVTDNLIFVSVPEDAPYLGQENILRIQTTTGVVEYPFSLLTITDFEEETVNGVNLVRIFGGDFTDVATVTFVSGSEDTGDLVEREANILDSSDREIIAEVPAGVVQAFIYVETEKGAVAQSESYGFNYPIYIDEPNDWVIGGWGGPQEESTEIALGTSSVKKVSAQWEGLTFTPGEDAEVLNFGDYSVVSFSVYGGPTVNSIKFAVNDFNNPDYLFDVVPGQWTKVEIPLRNLYPSGGAPATITRMDFQLASEGGTDQFYYVDQFGFIQ